MTKKRVWYGYAQIKQDGSLRYVSVRKKPGSHLVNYGTEIIGVKIIENSSFRPTDNRTLHKGVLKEEVIK